MRKVLVAPVAIVTPALARGSVAPPRITKIGHRATAAAGLGIFGLTQQARDFPDESYQGDS